MELISRERSFTVLGSTRSMSSFPIELVEEIKRRVWAYVYKRHVNHEPVPTDLIHVGISGNSEEVEIPEMPEGILEFKFELADITTFDALRSAVDETTPRSKENAIVLFFEVKVREAIPILADIQLRLLQERTNQLVLVIMKISEKLHCANLGAMRGIADRQRRAMMAQPPK